MSEYEGNPDEKKFSERSDGSGPDVLKAWYQNKIEPEIEDECSSCHNGNLLFVFRTHECCAQHCVDIEKNKSRS